MSQSLLGPRRAGPADAHRIRDLTRAVYAKWVPLIGREPKPMTADVEHALRNHWIDVVDDAMGLLAVIEMIPEPGFLLIENVAVRVDRQGEGLAAGLLDHAAAVARQHGFPELRLYTNAAFASNVTYYAKRGFVETGRTPLPDGGTMVHFTKPVS